MPLSKVDHLSKCWKRYCYENYLAVPHSHSPKSFFIHRIFDSSHADTIYSKLPSPQLRKSFSTIKIEKYVCFRPRHRPSNKYTPTPKWPFGICLDTIAVPIPSGKMLFRTKHLFMGEFLAIIIACERDILSLNDTFLFFDESTDFLLAFFFASFSWRFL